MATLYGLQNLHPRFKCGRLPVSKIDVCKRLLRDELQLAIFEREEVQPARSPGPPRNGIQSLHDQRGFRTEVVDLRARSSRPLEYRPNTRQNGEMERPETSTSQHDAQQVWRVVEQELECRIVGGDYDGDAVGRVARLEHRTHLWEQFLGVGARRGTPPTA